VQKIRRSHTHPIPFAISAQYTLHELAAACFLYLSGARQITVRSRLRGIRPKRQRGATGRDVQYGAALALVLLYLEIRLRPASKQQPHSHSRPR
jgi:hypothetical protein